MKFRREDFTKIMFGITALILGVLFLLCAYGVLDIRTIWPYWTLFIIIPTVGSIIANGVNIWKIVLLAVGINALTIQLHIGHWTFWQFVAANAAVIFILLGILLIFGNAKTEGIFNRNRGNGGQQNNNPNYPPYQS